MASRTIFLALSLCLLIGCGTKYHLVKDVTQEQLGKDNGECRLEAQKATQFDLSGNVFIKQNNLNQAYENCFQAKGYVYQQELNEQQQTISARYNQAIAKWNEKKEPINEHIINICGPKEDKEYISCINEKNNEFIAASFFPDIATKMFNARKEFEQQLVRKEITRKEFKENATKLRDYFVEQGLYRVRSDVKAGIYTGKY